MTEPVEVWLKNKLRLAFWHGVINNATNVPGGIFCVDEVSLQEVK